MLAPLLLAPVGYFAVPAAPGGGADEASLTGPEFEGGLIDHLRAGSEPVVAVLPSGTILVAGHPGWSHVLIHDPDRGVPQPFVAGSNGQVQLWRSTDDGATWAHVGLPLLEVGPRSAVVGLSDPDLAVQPDGTACLADLGPLSYVGVSCSQDDGVTWVRSNMFANNPTDRPAVYEPINEEKPHSRGSAVADRPYLAADEDYVYLTANTVKRSADAGLTWEAVGEAPCPASDFVSDASTGALVMHCHGRLAVSYNQGASWAMSDPAGFADSNGNLGVRLREPAVDAAGNVWLVADGSAHKLQLAGTPDHGATWPHKLDLTQSIRDSFPEMAGNFSVVWPWVSAGSEGRVAVTFYGAPEEVQDPQNNSVTLRVYTVIVLGADTDSPEIHPIRVTEDPVHEGKMCFSGTFCLAPGGAKEDENVDDVKERYSRDRRLGDFFETTIDHDGRLHVTAANTRAYPSDLVAHPMHFVQTAGPYLIAPEDLGTVRPAQG